MQTELKARCVVAMADIKEEIKNEQGLMYLYLPMKIRMPIGQAVESLERVIPFPNLSVRSRPNKKSHMSIDSCCSVLQVAYDSLENRVSKIVKSDREDLLEERDDMMILQGRFAALLVAARLLS